MKGETIIIGEENKVKVNKYIDIKLWIEKIGSSRINPGDKLLRFFFTVAFLLFLTLAGGSNHARSIF